SGQLVLLPGGSASRDVTFKSNEAYLWDFGDVAAGLVADSATVTAVQVPSAARCGEKLAMDLETLSPPRTGSYFTYVSASMKDRTGLLVSDKGRRFYVALPTPRRSLLLQGAYIRLDISHQDLARWRAADRTLECDATSTQYGTIVPAPASNLQHVTVTAIAACTERNDLYERETPEVEVEDQLHRGRFFEPLTHELQRSGNVIDLVIDVPPGAYELGVGFPRIAGTALGCVSSLRFAVVAGKRRHLTTTIHSWGLGGSGRGFLVATFQAQSIRVGILMLSREIPCYGNREQFVAALARDTPEDIDYAVSDGDSFYGTYFPYDPALQPVMVIDGPGITKAYVALPVRRQPHPLESLTVLKVTDRQLGRWFDGSNSNRLICDESLSQNRP
ncbi:MAG TPA: hypothetical protein VN936_11435, partial [Candidatus Acidoferrum sp.]|nr:hypothetical protein [Candidatus Acidoferrum sp.]